MSKRLKKQLAVRVIEKDLLAGIPLIGYMINRTGKSQSKRPCHAELVSGPFGRLQDLIIPLVLGQLVKTAT